MHFVTTLEEMPVQETLDGLGEVSRIGLHVGTIVVNMEREPLLSSEDLVSAGQGTIDLDRVSASLTKAGISRRRRAAGRASRRSG